MRQSGVSVGTNGTSVVTGFRRRVLFRRSNLIYFRPCAVNAPPKIKTHRQQESRPSKSGQSRGLAGALQSAIKIWEREERRYIDEEHVASPNGVKQTEVSNWPCAFWRGLQIDVEIVCISDILRCCRLIE